MVILALDAAMSCSSVAVVSDGVVLACHVVADGRGQSALLPGMVRAALDVSGLVVSRLDGVVVTVGPGSFSGLRAALALAHGLAAGGGIAIVGVTVAEALAEAAAGLAGRQLWVAIDSRRGQVFLHHDGVLAAYDLDALPTASGRLAVAGDAAIPVVARLLARGDDVMLTDARLPDAACVAAVGGRRLAGRLPPLAAQPLYVDAPAARLPAGGLRPAPRDG